MRSLITERHTLQDLVNEIGRRLDFTVTHGRYRGTSKQPGHDGIWIDGGGHSIIVEVKTTDAYRIDLDIIAGYRQALVRDGKLELEKSSMLVVVGRQDTGDLEAQIRGSRHAWDMRVISVDALFRMLKLKEEVEDPSILRRIHEILIPREFTRLDPIIEIAFAAVEDVKEEPATGAQEDDDYAECTGGKSDKKFTPVSFHELCVSRVEHSMDLTLLKQSRASFASVDGSTRLVCAISRFHQRNKQYWFAFHPHQESFLSQVSNAYVAFGCGAADVLFLIPFSEFKSWLDNFTKTELPNRFYWHIKIRESGKNYWMIARRGLKSINISKFLLS